MANDDLVFGIDIYRGDAPVVWELVAKSPLKPQFIGIRAGISWAYRDPFFQSSWVGAGQINLKRMPYFVGYFGEDAKAQVKNWKKIMDGQIGEGPEILDAELDHGYGFVKIQSTMYDILRYMEDEFLRKPIIYSRADWINKYISGAETIYPIKPPKWLNDYYWWLAHYNLDKSIEKQGPPALPKGVSREKVLIHQSAEPPTPAGFGTCGSKLDFDRWQNSGNPTFEQFFGTPIPVELTWEQSIDSWARLLPENAYIGKKP